MSSALLKKTSAPQLPDLRSTWYTTAMEQLLDVIQELSHARDVETIMSIVRVAARSLTGADGATFVLRDGEYCYYADENAIAPLWKGRRFPLRMCVSGWVMLNKEPAMIADIYADPRVPADAYRPTFVKSLAMVPIRRESPIGSIGNYWATPHQPTQEELAILQALADTTSVALENVELFKQLNQKISQLEQANNDLHCFAWSASHDLQEPLRTIVTQIELAQHRLASGKADSAPTHLERALNGASRLQHLVINLLAHAHAENTGEHIRINFGTMLETVKSSLQVMMEENKAVIEASELPEVLVDPHLMECVLQNLLSNAMKFHADETTPHIHISAQESVNEWTVTIRDNGIGIAPAYHKQIFSLFQRLHSQNKFAGAGIGLATCRKIVELHGGRIWVESTLGEGSAFHFTLPKNEE